MKGFLSISLVISAVALAQETSTLTIEQAIQIGLQNSKGLQVSGTRRDAAHARAREVGTSLLPSFKLESGYKRLSEVDPFRVQIPGSPSPVTISPVVLDNYTIRLAVQQPVFTGFRLRNTARAVDYLAQAAESDHQSDEADVILNIKNAYWLLYQTRETKKFVDENGARLEAHLKDTEQLMRAGLATRNDYLKLQVQLSNARLAQIDAQHEVRLAEMTLNNILGRQLDREVQAVSTPHQDSETEKSVERGPVVRAFSSRSDLQAMQFRLNASDASLSAARGSWWPQVFLSGSYYNNRPNSRYLPTRDAFLPSWEIGVQLQFDLWNWGATSHQVEQARAQLRQNEILFDQMKDNITLEVTRNELQLQRSREKIGVANIGVSQAEESFRTTNDKYKNGLATSSDLLDADVALLQARTNLTGALVEHELAKARLERSMGQ